jgi:type IV pilus assembly protein PilE
MTPRRRRGSGMAGQGARGFTLTELMIVAAIIAILAAVVVPGYSSYVTRAKRSAAKASLLQTAQAMERWYTANGNYGTSATLPLPLVAQSTACVAMAPGDSTSPNYCVGGAGTNLVNGVATAFSLTATPCGNSGAGCTPASNAGYTDAECNVLTLDNQGNKGVSPTTLNANQCWQR